MTSLEWTDPPAAALNRQSVSRYHELASELQRRPNQWARLPGGSARKASTAAALAQNIRRGVMKAFPKDQYEAVHDGTEVYARFIAADEPVTEEDERVNGHGSAVVRAWAKENGFPDLPERGRLPAEVREAYTRWLASPAAAHLDPPPRAKSR